MPRGKGTRNLWITSAINRLRELAAQGKTSTEISRIMGISRGAVIGKQQREGIILLGKPLFDDSRLLAKRNFVLPLAERSGVAAAMVALHQNHCRWPMGAPEAPDFHYCSMPRTNLERPYCAKHEAVSRSGVAMSNYARKNTLQPSPESV
jgi:hypothetical protein